MDGGQRNIPGHHRHLLGPAIHHLLVVIVIAADVAGAAVLLQATNTVFQSRCSRYCPTTGHGFLIDEIEGIKLAVGAGYLAIFNWWQGINIREQPRFGTAAQIAVGQ